MSFVAWCVVTEKLWYPIIVMDAFEQAAEMLEAIKAELEANPRTRRLPRGVRPGPGLARGRHRHAQRPQGRGLRVGQENPRPAPWRPPPRSGVMDDIENDENVNTPAQRDKLQAFVTKSVLSLGPPDDSMHAILVGTVLHYDSVLARFLKNPLWNKKVFKAIINWPENMHLWEQFEGCCWALTHRSAARPKPWRCIASTRRRWTRARW